MRAKSPPSAGLYLLMLAYCVCVSMFAGRLLHEIAFWQIRGTFPGGLRYHWYWPSYLVFGATAVVLYLPVLRWIREKRNGTRPRSLFALAGTLLGIVPAFLHVSLVESRLPARTPTDVMLLYAMYLVAGFVFGHCYVAMCRFEEK